MYALEVKELTVRLGKRVILEDVNLRVKRGEFWGIIGPNGGGKTTLLRSIIGIISPERGTVRIMGMPPREAIRRNMVGYLPQRVSGMVPFTPRDLMRLFGGENAHEMLKLVGMEKKADIPFERLSGGERQRVLIAAVLSKGPQVLLLDEPHTGVDIVAQDSFYNILRGLKERGITIVMVSHDIGVVANFVDGIACLNRRLKYAGDPWGALDCRMLEELYGAKVDVFVHHPECRGCHIYRR